MSLKASHPKNTEILNNAVKHHRAGNFSVAKDLYDKIRKTHPNNGEVTRLSGLLEYQIGNLENALNLLSLAISFNPKSAQAYANRALVFQDSTKLFDAMADYDKALSLNPNCAITLNNRGSLFKTLGELEKALIDYKKAVSIQPKFPQAIYNIGNVLNEQGHLKTAIQAYDQALKFNPELADGYINRGRVFCELGNFQKAIIDFKKAIEIAPKNAAAFSNLGYAQFKLKNFHDAFQNFNKALEIEPNYYHSLYNRGLVYLKNNRPEKAITDLIAALKLRPNSAEAHNNLGICLHKLGKNKEAINCFQKSLSITSEKGVYVNLAASHRALGNFREALEIYDDVIRMEPNFAEALFSKSLILLMLGNFSEGLELYEWRWKTENFPSPIREFNKPIWTGEQELSGKTILIHWEQGFGDTIQFCRLIKQLKQENTRIIFEVQKSLYQVMKSLDNDIELVEEGSELPEFDFYCPLLSLPHRLKLREESIPKSANYLKCCPKKTENWSRLLGKKDKPRIGIVWSGSKTHSNDKNRSIALKSFLNAFPKNLEIISLQKEVNDEDLKLLKNHEDIKIFGEKLDDFSDTAALCNLMDIIVTVDTSVAHLAGAIGKPVFLLIPFVPDFRWLLKRETTPWYQSVRIFRQKNEDNWSPALKNIYEELEEIASGINRLQ